MLSLQVRVLFSGNITRHPAFREFYARTLQRPLPAPPPPRARCVADARCAALLARPAPRAAFAAADKIMECGFLLGAHHGITTAQVGPRARHRVYAIAM